MSLDALMTSACDVQQMQTTKDPSGGQVAKPVTVASGVPCDIQPASASIKEFWARRGILCQSQIYFATDAGLRLDDRLVVTDEAGNVRYFKVLGYQPPNPRGNWPAVADGEEEQQPPP